MAKVEDKTKEQSTVEKTPTPPSKPAAQQPEPTGVELNVEQKAKDPLAGLGKEAVDQVKLIESLLNEYASTITKQSALGDSARGGFGKLHGAFRTMMTLRGDAHKAAAQVFMRAFKKHGKGSLDYDMRCRHLDLLARDSRAVFTGYLDLLCRFEKSTNKGEFRKNNNVDRLVSRIADPELASSINNVFPG